MEPRSINRHFSIQTYALPDARNSATAIYSFFTVEGNTLYRIENDLSGVLWVIARDMGKQRVVSSIDSNLLNYWATYTAGGGSEWTNIRVIHPGIARKFQVVSVPFGDREAGYYDTVVGAVVPQYNDGAYQTNILVTAPIYNGETDPANNTLVLGNADSTIHTNAVQNLPYGTFWAITHPLIIEYTASGTTYRRAIRHKINEAGLM